MQSLYAGWVFQFRIKQNMRTLYVILNNMYLIKILISSNLVIPSNDRHNKWILKSVLNRDLRQFVTEPIRFVSVISTSDNGGES